ncbi:MAG: Uma2 family endonuclease [Xanthobacteraceae bacterium]
MTVEEFYAFTDTRPENEKWELIEGEPVLQASPSRPHQRILLNVAAYLRRQAVDRPRGWEVLPGLGVRVSDTNRPEPDVLVLPVTAPSETSAAHDCDDVIVAFEIVSPSTADRDLRWKRNAYTSMPSLTHYVVIAQDAVDVVVFARENGFAEQRLRSLAEAIAFPALGVTLPLAEIHRGIGLAD